MKRLLSLIVIVLIASYIAYQNGAVWLLKLLSLTSSSGAVVASEQGASPKPPFRDGSYTGSEADAFYGIIQVRATIGGGKLTSVQFLQHPDHATRSIAINTLAMPTLQQEAIAAQSADVDFVSGATDSSNAFRQSLASALTQASNYEAN